MRIDIAAVKSSLDAENSVLRRSRDAFGGLQSVTSIDREQLSGRAFDKMACYCSNTLSVLADDMQRAIDEKMAANAGYNELLDRYFPGMSSVCLEDIERQHRDVLTVERQLADVLDNPFVKLATLGLSRWVNDLVQGPLKRVEAELQAKMDAFNAFMQVSQHCFDAPRAALQAATRRLGEAQSVWSESGGYSYAALKHVSGYRNITFGPDYSGDVTAEKYVAENGAVGSVCMFNLDGGVSCTYYTLRKLRERGVTFPFAYAGGANGGQWIDNCSDSVPKFRGSDAIDQLASQYGYPITNVVVTFGLPNPTGHVLLIDEVYLDENGVPRVRFSDIYDSATGEKLYDPSSHTPTRDMTLEEFYAAHLHGNGPVTGAILIGGSPEP